jgi:hypothetical protein
MSYSRQAGAPRKPGENLSAQGKPPTSGTPDAGPKNPTQSRRSAGASPQASSERPTRRPGGKQTRKKGKGRPIAPINVARSRNWGSIAIFTAVGLLVVGIVGYSSWQAIESSKTWQDRADAIDGILDYTKSHKKELAAGNGNHVPGRVQYFTTPSVGGNHNGLWQNCMGDVYPKQIASEHATHSLEHGAVWITYDPKTLPEKDVQKLAEKVKGNQYMLMSPFPDQGSPISLQTWGYQLKVNSATDSRIDEFIKVLRMNASVEPGAVCSGGVTATGIEPQGSQDPERTASQPAMPPPPSAPAPNASPPKS